MSFIDGLNKVISPFNIIIGRTDTLLDIPFQTGSRPNYSMSQAERIATVFTAIKILGETMSRLPLGVIKEDPDKGKQKDKDHYLYDILHYNPNEYTTSQTFISTLEVLRNLKGNSYAKINRGKDSGKVDSLELIMNSRVRGYVLEKGRLFYKVTNGDNPEKLDTIPAMDILHFRMISKDGIVGLNPIEALRLNLSTTWEALGTIDEYYKNNAVLPKALKSTVSGANQKGMLEALKLLTEKYKGPRGAGDILPLPPNTEIQELQMNAIDAAFLQMVELNANQIAALYGIPSHLVGNLTTSKYNNIEQTQISYKVNTISAIARMYRQELEYKLLTTSERKAGESIEFNLMALVETDHKSRLEGYRILSNIGAITPNKVATIEGLETYDGGDLHYIQTNMQAVEKYMKSFNTSE